MICNHCEVEMDAGDEMILTGCYSSPEIVCLWCWISAVSPYDCVQCLAEVRA